MSMKTGNPTNLCNKVGSRGDAYFCSPQKTQQSFTISTAGISCSSTSTNMDASPGKISIDTESTNDLEILSSNNVIVGESTNINPRETAVELQEPLLNFPGTELVSVNINENEEKDTIDSLFMENPIEEVLFDPLTFSRIETNDSETKMTAVSDVETEGSDLTGFIDGREDDAHSSSSSIRLQMSESDDDEDVLEKIDEALNERESTSAETTKCAVGGSKLVPECLAENNTNSKEDIAGDKINQDVASGDVPVEEETHNFTTPKDSDTDGKSLIQNKDKGADDFTASEDANSYNAVPNLGEDNKESKDKDDISEETARNDMTVIEITTEDTINENTDIKSDNIALDKNEGAEKDTIANNSETVIGVSNDSMETTEEKLEEESKVEVIATDENTDKTEISTSERLLTEPENTVEILNKDYTDRSTYVEVDTNNVDLEKNTDLEMELEEDPFLSVEITETDKVGASVITEPVVESSDDEDLPLAAWLADKKEKCSKDVVEVETEQAGPSEMVDVPIGGEVKESDNKVNTDERRINTVEKPEVSTGTEIEESNKEDKKSTDSVVEAADTSNEKSVFMEESLAGKEATRSSEKLESSETLNSISQNLEVEKDNSTSEPLLITEDSSEEQSLLKEYKVVQDVESGLSTPSDSISEAKQAESLASTDVNDGSDDDISIVNVSDVSPNIKIRRKHRSVTNSSINVMSDSKNMSDSGTIIELDSDDDSSGPKRKRKTRSSNNCINYECKSGKDMMEAPIFCMSYYRVKVNPFKLQEICQECFDIALTCYEGLCTAITNHVPLYEQEFPIRNDMVEIIDSDDESERSSIKKTEYYPEEVTEFISDNIDDIFEEALKKYDLDFQVKSSLDVLQKKSETMKSAFSEIDSLVNDIQKKLDKMRKSVYSELGSDIRPLPELYISDSNASEKCLIARPRNILTQSSRPVTSPQVQASSDAVSASSRARPNIPDKGPLCLPKLRVGELYYTIRNSVFGAWVKVRLTEIIPKGSEASGSSPHHNMYRVKIESKKGNNFKVVSGKQLAYSVPSPVRLEVGTRVIAVFKDNDIFTKKDAYFTGVIAEPLMATNDHRYLVFFDDGYAQYVTHNNVLVVTEASKNVWEDVHPDSQMFIKKYLEGYPDRPMVKLQAGQIVKTEWNGKWWIARVLKVEGSLVQMHFDADARSEWIYRGSTRLGPLFLEMQAANNRQQKDAVQRSMNVKKLPTNVSQRNVPYVEYTRNDQEAVAKEPQPSQQQLPPPQPRAVARKSTARPVTNVSSQSSGIVPFLPTAPQVQQPQSKVVYYTPRVVVAPIAYKPHECSLDCKKEVTHPLSLLKGYNPLSKPLLCGWYRLIVKHRGKREIKYRAPCGRTIRNIQECHQYLRVTGSELSVDLFDFDFWVHCLAEFVLDKSYTNKKDMSLGVENVPVPCVNYVDNTLPDFCNYSTKREPMEGVHLNLDPEFLVGCDCTDDCQDRQKCSCWQLTLKGTAFMNKKIPDNMVGYIYKRLPEPVVTGIYECNSRCKCAATCLNRVVQHPLSLKLQVFKTHNRGWGIRCLNDIPQGAFICIYAGSLLTEQMANEGGKNYGDEYLAELDYIEVVERLKDGYESDVADDESEEDSKKSDEDDDDDEEIGGRTEVVSRRKAGAEDDTEFTCILSGTDEPTESSIRTRLRKRNVDDSKTEESKDKNEQEKSNNDSGDDTVTISDDEDVREPSRFSPKHDSNLNESLSPKYKSVRELFGEHEACYVMDAKNTGNIGRYLNHSCTPNVFVQNVFVDTHDLRFPWVAFFALTYIRSGSELTWNYNYDVGSVPGKVLYCHCGSPECRGRLL